MFDWLWKLYVCTQLFLWVGFCWTANPHNTLSCERAWSNLKTKHSMWYAGYTCKYFSSKRCTKRGNKSIIDKNIMPLVFLTCICPLVLKLQGKLKNKQQSPQPYDILTDNNAHWAMSEDKTLLKKLLEKVSNLVKLSLFFWAYVNSSMHIWINRISS